MAYMQVLKKVLTIETYLYHLHDYTRVYLYTLISLNMFLVFSFWPEV